MQQENEEVFCLHEDEDLEEASCHEDLEEASRMPKWNADMEEGQT